MKRAIALSSVLLAALLAHPGCGGKAAPPAPPPAPPAPLVLTLAPTAATAASDPVLDLPTGSRLVVVDPAAPGAAPRALSEGLESAGDARLSPDGTRVLFTARERADAPWAVWTCRLDGGERRAALAGPADVLSGAWLPDGRIVAMSALGRPSGAPGFPRAYGLVVGAGDGTAGRRITFGAGLDLDPALLPDGRIVYVAWRPAASEGGAGSASGAFALWTVHSDGSGADLYHDPGAALAMVRRPRPAADGRVAYLAGADAQHLAPRLTDARLPLQASTPLAGVGAGLRSVEPFGAGFLLASASGSALLTVGGTAPNLGSVAAGGVRHAVAAAPGRRPQGHLSVVDETKATGQLLLVDARPAGATAAQRLRVWTWTPPDAEVGGRPGRALGEAPLQSDGSVFAVVPADVPLLLEVLDADGRALSRTHTPIWVRPNESRGCVGCHEDRDLAPPNRRPLAVRAAPRDLTLPPPTEAPR